MQTTERVIDLSKGPVAVRLENSLIQFRRKGNADVNIPIRDIAVLVVSTPYATLTQPAIAALAKEGVCIVFCDQDFMPAAMCLPFGAHHQPAARFIQQAQSGKVRNKRLWRDIVACKIRHQAALLKYLHNHDAGLETLAGKVLSGDTANMEARAARRYWETLFGNTSFVRDREAPDINARLNYAYTVLRAVTARAICAAGLHPGLGVHHHHRENSFCLADDLMEPFRVYADISVYKATKGGTSYTQELSKEEKASIIRPLLEDIDVDGQREPLFYTIARLASSLAHVYSKSTSSLRLPTPAFATWAEMANSEDGF